MPEPASQGSLRIRKLDHTVTFQANGWVNMQLSPRLRQCASQCLAEGARMIEMDLRDCSGMDSTFIGTLLIMQKELKSRQLPSLRLVAPSQACQTILKRMRVGQLFAVVDQNDPTPTDWSDLPRTPDPLFNLQGTILFAHQELAALPDEAGAPFRALAAQMSRECAGAAT
jgi:anti-anti-sigma regulatory factor